MSKSIFSILAIALSLAVLSPTTKAADKPSDTLKNNVTQACQSDIQKYCSDVSSGGGRVMACLRAHDDKLSGDCSKQWEQAKTEWKSTMKGAHAACSSDVQKFCSGADNPKDVMNCLNDHTKDLSSACQTYRSKNQMTG